MIEELDLARITGLSAFGLLCASLLASLHGRTRRHRRLLGLIAAAAAAAHAGYVIRTPLVEELGHLIFEPHLRAGATALVVLAILSITSFPRLFKTPEWPALHRLAYAAALLSLHHLWLSSHARRADLIFGTGAVAALLTLRLGRGILRRSRRATPAAQPAHPPTSTPGRP